MPYLRNFAERGINIFDVHTFTYYRNLIGNFNASSKFEVLEFFIEQDWDPTYINLTFCLSDSNFIFLSTELAGLMVVLRHLLSVGYAFHVNENLTDLCERGDRHLESAKLLRS